MKKTTQKVFMFLVLSLTVMTAKAAPRADEKEWTFLLFLNGHNNLSSYGDMNLKDMEKVGSSDKVNIVVQWGSAEDPQTKRLLVQKSTDPSKVTSPIIESQANVDMGDYHQLVDFVKWGVDRYPAKHYFVAVWNHGSGWHMQEMKKGNVSINDISFDDNSGNHITTEQLGVAMAEIKQYIGRNIDIYGSDACLMQMVEVAAEMKDSVNYFVGSEETEPGEGWPYAPFMQRWIANPEQTPAEVSVALSQEYLKAYSPGGVYGTQSITFSALDMSKLDAVIASSAKLAAHLSSMDVATLKKIKSNISKVQAYYTSDYKDYGDFLKVVKALPIQKDTALLDEVSANIKSMVLSVDSSASFAKSTGLSIWIPNYSSSYMARYKGLAFDKAANWSGFLQKVLK